MHCDVRVGSSELLTGRSCSMPCRTMRNHAALPWSGEPAFFQALQGGPGEGARALALLTLAAARSGEVLGARRSEFSGSGSSL